jgi:hypothetical protein
LIGSTKGQRPNKSTQIKAPDGFIPILIYAKVSPTQGETMRDILEAKIASLEELAGQLKGLSELKQSVADDQEYPPHNADELLKKAREHKREAIAALTAVHTLKAVRDHGKTKGTAHCADAALRARIWSIDEPQCEIKQQLA